MDTFIRTALFSIFGIATLIGIYSLYTWIRWLNNPVHFVKAPLKKILLTIIPALMSGTVVFIFTGPLAPLCSLIFIGIVIYKGLMYKHIPFITPMGKELIISLVEKWSYGMKAREQFLKQTIPMTPEYRFKDKVAGDTEWKKLEECHSSGNFTLHKKRGTIIIKKGLGDYFFPLLFTSILVSFFVASILEFNQSQGPLISAFYVVITGFMGKYYIKIFASGFKEFEINPKVKTLTSDQETIILTEIYAVQIIAFVHTYRRENRTRYRNVFQVNAILQDGKRVNLTSVSDRDAAEANGELIAKHFKIPLWNYAQEKRIAMNSPSAKEMSELSYEREFFNLQKEEMQQLLQVEL